MRTLKLLEQHHEKLAQLIKFQSAHAVPQSPSSTPETNSQAQKVPNITSHQLREGSPYRAQQQAVSLPQRDTSSSIASNLASARGIPSNRQRRTQGSSSLPQNSKIEVPNPQHRSKAIEAAYKNARALPLTEIPQHSGASPIPPSLVPNATSKPLSSQNEPQTAATKSDEPFQKFYQTFESLFSKLSAPLAFAGLPLNADENPARAPHAPKSTSTSRIISAPSHKSDSSSRRPLEASQRVSADPDYNSLFSRAALRAVADEHGPGSVGANESFYVVPTSGHTLAYADVLARQHQEKKYDRRNHSTPDDEGAEEGFEGDEDLFVDARETPGPPSPSITRKKAAEAQSNKRSTTNKTLEELEMENEAIKTILDQTSRRLLDFEMSAQTSSVALQRSIRQLQSADTGGGAGSGNKGTEERMRALEQEVLEKAREVGRMERENEKLKGVVGRYRERWETLKAGARAKREGSGRAGEEE